MKIGWIGTGNMGLAILKGYLEARPGEAVNVYVYNHHREKAHTLAKELGIHATESISQLVSQCHMILLAVKPHSMEEVLLACAPVMTEDKVIVSIAAGVSLTQIEAVLKENAGANSRGPVQIIRAMPNTPASVREAMTALCRNKAVSGESFDGALALFQAVGRAQEVKESLIDAVIGVSGSSPAYVFMFIEALADGAVSEGMPRAQAYEFAAQSVLGAAKLMLETGKHPGELKDQVCSPGGTTIDAVSVLEEAGFRHSVMAAVRTAAEKSRSMSE